MANWLVRFNVAAVTIFPDELITNVPLSMSKAEVLEASAHVVGLALVIVPALRVKVSVEASPSVVLPLTVKFPLDVSAPAFQVPVAIVPRVVILVEPAHVVKAVFSTLPRPNDVLAAAPVSAAQVEPLPTIKLESAVERAAMSASNELYDWTSVPMASPKVVLAVALLASSIKERVKEVRDAVVAVPEPVKYGRRSAAEVNPAIAANSASYA